MKAIRSLWQTLREIKGNQRACVITEPLWAVPYQLISPFVSMYMAAVGLHDTQIGSLASISLALQFIWGIFSGAIVDKYGRRGTMLCFGLISWTIPCLIWASTGSFQAFALAAAINSMWRVTGNSFSCMIVEDGDPQHLVRIWAILNVLGIAAGFLSPLMGFAIGRLTLVPAMRGLYVLAAVMMTVKFILQYLLTKDSCIGLARMRECRGRTLLQLSFAGFSDFHSAMKEKRLLLCLLMMVLSTCIGTTQGSFWMLFVSRTYHLTDAMLAAFPPVKSAASLAIYLLVIPRLNLNKSKRPLLTGLLLQGLGIALPLLLAPVSPSMIWVLFAAAVCDAASIALMSPMLESLMALSIPSGQRASINSLIYGTILLLSTPVGWLAGQLASISQALPLVLSLCLIALQAVTALHIARVMQQDCIATTA